MEDDSFKEDSKDEDSKDYEGWSYKEIFSIYRVYIEDVSYDEPSPLTGAKDFSELREGKTVESSIAEVAISSNLHSI